jgi:hypothetical protein
MGDAERAISLVIALSMFHILPNLLSRDNTTLPSLQLLFQNVYLTSVLFLQVQERRCGVLNPSVSQLPSEELAGAVPVFKLECPATMA